MALFTVLGKIGALAGVAISNSFIRQHPAKLLLVCRDDRRRPVLKDQLLLLIVGAESLASILLIFLIAVGSRRCKAAISACWARDSKTNMVSDKKMPMYFTCRDIK